MKMQIEITVPENMTALADQVARAALTEVMFTEALPEAQRLAPGSIPGQIKVQPVVQVGPGEYRVGLSAPNKYRPVEYGSGIFAGDSPWEVYPVKAKALKLATGYYARRVVIMGQRAQPFLRPAMKLATAALLGSLTRAFNRSGASRHNL